MFKNVSIQIKNCIGDHMIFILHLFYPIDHCIFSPLFYTKESNHIAMYGFMGYCRGVRNLWKYLFHCHRKTQRHTFDCRLFVKGFKIIGLKQKHQQNASEIQETEPYDNAMFYYSSWSSDPF